MSLESQERELHALAELPRSTRCALFQHLRDIMIDRSALACLQSVVRSALFRPTTPVLPAPASLRRFFFLNSPLSSFLQLEDLCCSQSPDMTENDEASEGDGNVVSDLLDQLSLEYPVEESASCSPTQMNAAHLLVSALEGEGNNQNRKNPPRLSFHMNEYSFVLNFIVELPDQTLNLLSRATPEFLEAFDKLVSSFASFPICLQIILIQAFQHVCSVQLFP